MAGKKKKADTLEGAIEQMPPLANLEMVKESGETMLRLFANAVSGALSSPTAGRLLAEARSWTKALDNIEGLLKKRIILILKEHGQEVEGTKGTLRAVVDGVEFEMRPYRTGTDPKKLEALLRAKNLDPMKYMDTKLEFVVSQDAGRQQLLLKSITEEELKTCDFSESWTVITPKEVG